MRKSGLNINCCIACYVVVLMLFCVGSSPLINSSGTDSSIFIVIGRAMLKGKVAYKDLFDHKGLYLYFLNCLAAFISSRSFIGLFAIESVFMFACARIVFAVFSRYSDEKVSWLGMQIFLSVVLSRRLLFGGNLTEEYALIFQMCSIYLLILYLDSSNITYKPLYMFLQGITASAVFFLRPNMIMMWGAIAVLVGVDLLRHKDFSGLFKNLAAGLLGIAAGAAPAVIYAVVNDSVQDTVFAMFNFNMLYTALDWDIKQLIIRILLILKNKDQRYLILLLFISAVIMLKNRRGLYYYAMLFMCTISVSLSGRQYGHYYLYLVPLCLPLVYYLAHEINILNKSPESFIKFRTAVLAVFLLTFITGTLITGKLIDLVNRLNVKQSSNAEYIEQIMKCNESYHYDDEKVLVTKIHYAKLYNYLAATPHEKYFYTPAIPYSVFPDPVNAQAESIISGTNDVVIVVYDNDSREIYSETDRSSEIKHVLETQYDLLYYAEENNIAMYGKKR